MEAPRPVCVARLRDGSRCRSVATIDELCAPHAHLAMELGSDVVANGHHPKKRTARERVRAVAESAPVDFAPRATETPSGVRPALALAAAEEVESIRRVLLDAATSTTRETWATCTCPECQKTFRQEISVPDHGARIKAVETLLREGLGRVGKADAVEPRMPTTADEVNDLSWKELKLVFALWHTNEIKAVVEHGDGALRAEVERWEPEARTAVAAALAAVGG